jgi:hypothetical protein
MAFTAAMCKSQNVKTICSPLNGGLMENIFLLRIPVTDGRNRYNPIKLVVIVTPASLGQPGLGDDV